MSACEPARQLLAVSCPPLAVQRQSRRRQSSQLSAGQAARLLLVGVLQHWPSELSLCKVSRQVTAAAAHLCHHPVCIISCLPHDLLQALRVCLVVVGDEVLPEELPVVALRPPACRRLVSMPWPSRAEELGVRAPGQLARLPVQVSVQLEDLRGCLHSEARSSSVSGSREQQQQPLQAHHHSYSQAPQSACQVHRQPGSAGALSSAKWWSAALLSCSAPSSCTTSVMLLRSSQLL